MIERTAQNNTSACFKWIAEHEKSVAGHKDAGEMKQNASATNWNVMGEVLHCSLRQPWIPSMWQRWVKY
jgi:hypothetical protein